MGQGLVVAKDQPSTTAPHVALLRDSPPMGNFLLPAEQRNGHFAVSQLPPQKMPKARQVNLVWRALASRVTR